MDREDLAQELRIAILKAAKSFDDSRGIIFHTYLHTTLLNTIRTLMSKVGRQPEIRSLDAVYENTNMADSKILEALQDPVNHEEIIHAMDLLTNHNLSKNSYNWQQHCESFCSSNNIEFESFMVKVSKNRSSIESQARQARYKIFESLLDENDKILLAHHRDDVFETILLRLFRGTGVDGLSGLNEKRSLGK